MSRMNALLPLQVQTPDIVGSLSRGLQAASAQNQVNRQNQVNALYRDQGAGILAGEQGALNALAQLDPQQAVQIQGQQQTQRINEEKLSLARKDAALRARSVAAQLSAAEAAEAAAAIKSAVAGGLQAQTPEQWDAHMQSLGQTDLVGRFADRELIAGSYLGIADALEMAQGPEGAEDPAAIRGLRIRAEEAGLVPGTPEYQQFMLSGGTQKSGLHIETRPDGSTVVRQGPGVTSDRPPEAQPSSPEAMINSIDGILDDPALDFATGFLEWTQGIPGTASRRFAARARQLEGQAFLQAFESLKGGGQITEIEGQKATQAIGRLDTSQSASDYRDALTELRSILELAKSRPEGWIEKQDKAPQDLSVAPPDFPNPENWEFLPDDLKRKWFNG